MEDPLKVARVILQKRVFERLAEQAVDVPVSRAMEETVEVLKVIPWKRTFENTVEQTHVSAPRVVENPSKWPK